MCAQIDRSAPLTHEEAERQCERLHRNAWGCALMLAPVIAVVVPGWPGHDTAYLTTVAQVDDFFAHNGGEEWPC